MALDDVQADLEREHYEVRKFVLPAVAVDAHHRRDRVFIIAYRDPTLAHSHGEGQLQQEGLEREVGRWSGDSGKESESVAYAYDKGLQGGSQTRDLESKGETAIEQSSRFCELRRGRNWPVEPSLPRMAHGVPNRVDRVKALGNAVVPQLIQAIGELVLAADKEIYGCK